MQLTLEWERPLDLVDGSAENLIYSLDAERLPHAAGIYVFGRVHGGAFEALYVGKAGNLAGRVAGQLNNLRLMNHVRNARTGTRILLSARIVTRQGQQERRVLDVVEKAFIKFFLSAGHDLVNKQGARIRRHEIGSRRRPRVASIPKSVYVERGRGE